MSSVRVLCRYFLKNEDCKGGHLSCRSPYILLFPIGRKSTSVLSSTGPCCIVTLHTVLDWCKTLLYFRGIRVSMVYIRKCVVNCIIISAVHLMFIWLIKVDRNNRTCTTQVKEKIYRIVTGKPYGNTKWGN